jgi:outer membrane murein-binding lipoprotein Lpp
MKMTLPATLVAAVLLAAGCGARPDARDAKIAALELRVSGLQTQIDALEFKTTNYMEYAMHLIVKQGDTMSKAAAAIGAGEKATEANARMIEILCDLTTNRMSLGKAPRKN